MIIQVNKETFIPFDKITYLKKIYSPGTDRISVRVGVLDGSSAISNEMTDSQFEEFMDNLGKGRKL